MGLLGGGFLRLFQTFLYLLAFCCSAIIIGFYSYFLAVLSDRHEFISKDWKAVEGISGAAVLYTIAAVILTCFLGGITFFGLLAVILNVLFCAAFIAIAVLTRAGASTCSGDNATSPLGSGQSNQGSGFGSQGFGLNSNSNATYQVTYGNACRYNKAVFAVSIIGAFLFLFLTFTQIMLVRHHKKEKRYGPGPSNNYTSGSGKRRFWQRKNKGTTAAAGAGGAGYATRDPEVAAVRPSHDTAYTGSTMAGPNAAAAKEGTHNHHLGHSTHGGYYTQPEGTGVNPYGYSNGTTGHTTTHHGV